MVETMNDDSAETVAFQALAQWAKSIGASHLAVKDGHYEIAFFPDPRVFSTPEKPGRELTDAEKEDALRAAADIGKRKLYRSV
jgi:hypothetical protein